MAPDATGKRRPGPGLVMVSPHMSKPHRSDAVHFEVCLNEALALSGAVDAGAESTSGPDSKRLACHVAVLRSILASGMLGQLQHVLETVFSELLRAAYSNDVTTSPLGEASGTYAGIEGIPYFEQLRESQQEVASLTVQLEEQRQSVEKSINYLKERALQDAPSLDEEEVVAKMGQLEMDLQGLREEKSEALHKVEMAEREKVEALLLMEAEVRRWRQEAQDARRETKNLKKKAKEQEAVRLAFAELRQPALTGPEAAPPAAVPSMAQQLKEENELAEAVAMESQLILLQNARIDEYEAALGSTPPSEVGKLRDDFVQEMQAMQDEMVKLRHHIRSFEDRLPASSTPLPRSKAASPVPGPEPVKQVDMEVSFDGGVTFSPLRTPPHLKMLTSKSAEFQAAFTLPKDATHVRIKPHGVKSPSPSPLPGRASPQNENTPPDIARRSPVLGVLNTSETDETGRDGSTGPSSEDPLWDGYFARIASWGGAAAALAPTTSTQSRIPRSARGREVELEHLLGEIESIFRAKLRSEGGSDLIRERGHKAAGRLEAPSVTGTRTSLHVFFYKWLEEKYGARPTVLLVAHGLLSAVEHFREQNPVVRLFGQVMAGQSEDATWRYTMQWRRVASPMRVESRDEFQDFLVTLYPGMKEEEVAALCTAYATFTSTPSKQAAIEFLTDRLLLKSEPRVKKWAKILKWKDTSHKNGFRRPDFLDIVGKLFPMLSLDEAAAQYDAAARGNGGDWVPVDALALITSCLDASLVASTKTLQSKKQPSLLPVTGPS